MIMEEWAGNVGNVGTGGIVECIGVVYFEELERGNIVIGVPNLGVVIVEG